MGPTLGLVRMRQRRKNTTQVARKFARPPRSYESHNTKPGDFAIVDACKIVIEDSNAARPKVRARPYFSRAATCLRNASP